MYNKLFAKILDSSIWLESDGTRIVWLTLLAAMDQDGFVQFASVPNLAYRARVSQEVAAEAVAVLEGADPHSSDPDNDGRRIDRVPGGWMVLNATKYQEIVTRKVQRDRTRERVARHRRERSVTPCNADGADVTPCNAPSADVTLSNASVTPSDTETDAHTETETNTAEAEPAAWMWFPCVGTEKMWPLLGPQLQTWCELYPRLDIPAECNKAAAWLSADPSRRKTAKGMPRFLVGWFNRATDRGAVAPKPVQTSYRPSSHDAYDRWKEECRRLHNDQCGNFNTHSMRMEMTA